MVNRCVHAEQHDIIIEQCRKLIMHHQFNNESLRILLASLVSGLRNTDAFITSTLQKHLFREMKLSGQESEQFEVEPKSEGTKTRR